MSDPHLLPPLSPAEAVHIDQTCDRFEAAWKAGQRPDVREYLGATAEPVRSALLRQLLLLDWDYSRRAGGTPRVDDYSAHFSGDSTMIEEVCRELTASCDSTWIDTHERDATPWPSGPADHAVGEDGAALDVGLARYHLLHEIGQGGIGIVFRGRDRHLGRDLAVKLLREAYLDDADARRRFSEEARIGSQLQHPGIVPVYELGGLGDRWPYFTMKLVAGHTLAALLQRRADSRQDLPRLLSVFEQVCQAIAYAHSRGVVHRDLKPANVMVGAFGEVQVMDWVFAKVLDAERVASGDPSHAEEATNGAQPGPVSGRNRASVSGVLMGTPAYMPPEQARGEVARIDRRADVFALGAILCEILTGLPPHGGGSADEVCVRASGGDLADADARLDASGADPSLSDLAKRCLAAETSARPSDAGVVAHQVTDYLASAQERLRKAEVDRAAAEARAGESRAKARAERRARRLTLALAAAVLLLILGAAAVPSVGFVLLRAEQKQTEAERLAAVAAREDEARRRQQARQALDMLTGPVIEEWLGKQPQLSPEHQKFLDQALAAYREFTAETATDEASRAALARAYHQVGSIQRLLGRMVEAEEAYDQSVAMYTALVSETGRIDYRKALVRPLNYRIIIWNATGRGEQAVPALHDLVRMLRNLATATSDSDTLSHLALSLTNLGSISDQRGKPLDAEGALREAVTIYEKLIVAHPVQAAQFVVSANMARANLGIVLDMTARHADAERTYRDALTSLDRLPHAYLNQREVRQLVSAVHTNLGALLHRVRRLPEAEVSHRTALEIRRQLVADFPAQPSLRGDLALSHKNLGIVLASLDRREDAVEAYGRAIALYEKLTRELPNERDYRSALALAHFALGSLLRTMDRAEEAEAADRTAARLYQELAAGDPAVPDYRHYVAGSHVRLAGWHHKRGEWAEARRVLEEALPHHRAAIQTRPRHRSYRQFLCANRFQLANTYLAENDHAGLAEAAGQLVEAAAAEFPSEIANAASFLARCATLAEKDPRLPDSRRAELASSYAERAMATLRLAVQSGYKDVAALKKGPFFASVRARPDFQDLLVQLEKSQKNP